MVLPLIGRAAAIAAAKLLAKKHARPKKQPSAIKAGEIANKQPRTASQRPVTSRATSTANRRKSDSLDKVIKQIERGELQPRKVPRGRRKLTEKHMENKLNYRFRYGKDRWK